MLLSGIRSKDAPRDRSATIAVMAVDSQRTAAPFAVSRPFAVARMPLKFLKLRSGRADILRMTGPQTNDTGDREARTLSRAQDIPKANPDLLERIRARIREGGYATDGVLRATARAILERGDL